MSTDAMAFPSPAVIEKLNSGHARQANRARKASDDFEMVESMDELNQPSDNTPAEQDDFQQVKGIGPFIAQTLIDLEIYSFEQLAELTPDHLSDLLCGRVPAISPQRIENGDWIGQARSLALAKQGISPAKLETPEQSETHSEKQAEEVKKAPREGWRELADFFVSFGYAIGPQGEERLQTKVHYSQGDRFEKWADISTQQLIHWMLTQADLPIPPELEASSVSDKMDAEPSVETEPVQAAQLEIEDLWVSEMQTPLAAGESELNTFLQAEARLILSGPEAIDLASNRIPFTFDFYLVNTENNRSELIATTSEMLTPGEMVYEVQEVFQVPPVGRYQFFVVASLLPPYELVTHLQGPIIRVKPRS